MLRILIVQALLLITHITFGQVSGRDAIKAILNDQVDVLKTFLKQGGDPNGLYGKAKVPLLHYAASLNKVFAVKLLTEKDANIEKLFDDRSPLMIAAGYKSEAVIKELLKRGADINAINSEGETAFILAAKKIM